MSEDRATLTAKERDNLDDSDFAYVSADGEKHLPIHDEAHVKAAMSRFGQTQFASEDEKPAAAKKIVAKAKELGVSVSADTDVGKAAGLSNDVEAKSMVIDGVTYVEQTAPAEERADGDDGASEEVECPTCGGDGTIMDGNRECPDCGGDGTVAPDKADSLRTEPKRGRRRQRRDLPRHGERRLFTTTIELRGQMEGDVAVLRGTPIVFNAPYSVRDWQGPFTERMKPTVVDDVLKRGDLDCRFLENHDGRPMARTTNGTLTLTRGQEGVEAEARVDVRRSDSRDLALAIERKDVTQMSCGFIVADDGDEWRVGDDGTEERDIHSFGELFDVSAVTYPASPTTSIELAQRMLMGISDESRERLRRLWHIAKDIRSGAVLSQQNGADLMAALEALHEADDVDIPGIVRSLQTIDQAVDLAQTGISEVLGRADPDGDPDDLEPALVPPDDSERQMQRQRLMLIRARSAS